MKITIHAGLHRAASSSFQRYLREHDESLAGQGVFAATPRRYREPGFGLLRNLVGSRIERLGAAGAAETVREIIAPMSGTTGALLLSDENLLGHMPGKMEAASAHRHLLAALVSDLARDHQVELVLILREHVRYLISLHGFGIMRGDAGEFGEFVRGIRRESLLLGPLLDEMRDACAPAQLSVHTLEQIALDGGAGFLKELSISLGTAFPADRLPQVNASLPPTVLAVLRELARRDLVVPAARSERMIDVALRLARDPSRKGLRRQLAAMLAKSAISVPRGIEGHMRREFAAAIQRKGEYDAGGLELPEALALIDATLADGEAAEALFPNDILRELWTYFEEDRLRLAKTHAPEWRALPSPARSDSLEPIDDEGTMSARKASPS